MRRSILLSALFLILPVWAGLAGAQPALRRAPGDTDAPRRRVALVVGIGAYEQAGRLEAAVGDAQLMARTLQAVGFTLVGGGPLIDADKRGLDAAIEEFGRLAQGADIAFFHFSGHGLQHNGGNWLAARDSVPPGHLAGLELSHVDVAAMLRLLEAAQARLSVMVLDASRGDPSRNLAEPEAGAGLAPMRPPRGVLIASSAQPGRISPRDSRYTAALVEAMRMPGLGLAQMFDQAALRAIDASGGRQEPWLAMSPLRGDFVFTSRDDVSPPVPAQAPLHNPDFTLVNFAGQPVRELYASLSGEEQMGEDRLGGNLFQAGERFRLTFPRDHGCEVDVRAAFGQGAETSEVRHIDTCRVDMLVLTPQGRLIPADPDVWLVNETGRPIRRIEAALTSDTEWGGDRLEGKVMAPASTLELLLPHGLTCDIDIRAQFLDGSVQEWSRQDTCAVARLSLR